MASARQNVFVPQLNQWETRQTKKDGTVEVKDHFTNIQHMATAESVGAFLGYVKDAPKKRIAAVSLICDIMKASLDLLGGYKGTADKRKNLPKELKDSMQSAEEKFFRPMLADPKFVAKLPKMNARNEPLEVGGKLNQEAQFMYFLTMVRTDPTYANMKNAALGYWGYCGLDPWVGDEIVPPEVMRLDAQNARETVPPDRSVRARLLEIHREIFAESKLPPGDDLPTILQTLKELVDKVQTLENAEAQRRTQAGKGVPADANKAIESARATLDSVGKHKAVKESQEPAEHATAKG